MNSYIFINNAEIYKIKTKDFEKNAVSLFLGNVSKDFPVDNMKRTGLYKYVYDFSVDYGNIGADDILDIHKFLMKKHI